MSDNRTVEERFNDMWEENESGCRIWTGSLYTGNYGAGRFTFNGTAQPAHRVLWIMTHGEITRSCKIKHTCDEPTCVNIDHLYADTFVPPVKVQAPVNPKYTKGLTIAQKFALKWKESETVLSPNVDTKCWLWQNCLNGTGGYGVLRIGNRKIKAHRISYELHHGEIPKGQYVLHKCDNPACVNPNHLFLGTYKDNMQDMYKKGRAPDKAAEANGNASLTEDDVREIRRKYATGSYFQKDLAAEYDTPQANISRIILRKLWKDVKD